MAIAVRRLIPPVMLLALGTAAVFYGVRLHARTVEMQEEVTVKVPVPPKPKIPGWSMFGLPPQPPAPPPRKEKIWVETTLSEPVMVKDVTVGGLTLIRLGKDQGIIRRTYFGDMPSLCPT